MIRKIFILGCIFFLAYFLRFWELGGNPPSLDWDEASLGYNAYSILTTGRDEYGSFMPLSFRSFGDYKPPLYTYLTVFPVWLFGLNEFSTRFISAFFGSLSVVIGYLLIRKLFPGQAFWRYALFTFLFALSPWHIQFSRVAFEANLSVFFFLTGVYFFLGSRTQKHFFLASLLSFATSLYAYHSPRLMIPLFLVGLFILFRNQMRISWRWFISAVAIFLLLISPIFTDIGKSTSARFGSVTILNDNELLKSSIGKQEEDRVNNDVLGSLMHNRRIVYAKAMLGGYLDHFNFDFLFLTGDAAFRHHAFGMGMLYLWEFPFLVFGVLVLLGKLRHNQNVQLLFLWFLVSPISSSITKATPHAVRSLLFIPTHEIFITFGIVWVLTKLAWKKNIFPLAVPALFFFFLLNIYYYLHMYWVHTPVEYSQEWQYGYKQVVQEVTKLEQNFKKIIVTYRYDQPYIYFLFYKKVDPFWYQQNWKEETIGRFTRKFGKYEFRNLDWREDRNEKNVLFVSIPNHPDEIPDDTDGIVHTVYFLNGKVAMRIVAR
ncbi:glycosyltransferase family 39 protein [Candidatus Gottesmanbacteria bacterium]|nr:glycosyltransferase family 39 protein [Candidatus Gottesmanbacteria bacterium]